MARNRDAGSSGPHERQAFDAALAGLYDELRRIAQRQMSGERAGHTLQATAVVHEAWQRLRAADGLKWGDEHHLKAIAAGVMRQVLVDHARKHRADKRGGDRQRVTLHEDSLGSDQSFDVLDLHEAIDKLTALDADAGRLIELRYFAGMSLEEACTALGVSRRKVDQDWAFARVWLARELLGEP